MATINIWQQFKTLIPEASKTVVTIISNNGDGTSTAQLRDGTRIKVQGETITPNNKAIVQGNKIITAVPDLPSYGMEI